MKDNEIASELMVFLLFVCAAVFFILGMFVFFVAECTK